MTWESLTESLTSTGSPALTPQLRATYADIVSSGMVIIVTPTGSKMLERFKQTSSPHSRACGLQEPQFKTFRSRLPSPIRKHPFEEINMFLRTTGDRSVYFSY